MSAAADSPEQIFERAAARARQMGLPYAGAVTPREAQQLASAGAASIVDVRSPQEYQFVGHIPDTPLIEWPRSGEARAVQGFVDDVQGRYEATQPLLFLCRSGVRSHYAAQVLKQAGFTRTYNILEGFEGPQGTQSGWKAAGLPWKAG